ncbi:MAG: hypothetical protein DWQ19_12530 [Crenarchaeota archaeon]|nr:MAG: hypothetical protein DWQ19_12530 [Thermoproteota archaeon]
MKNYLYLARRDKKGIKILIVLKGHHCPAGRLADIKKLGLPVNLEQQIQNKIYETRMLWEPWIESAENYKELKDSLRKRGFSAVPMGASPLFFPEKESIVSKKIKDVKIGPIIEEKKTMLRKKN